jgi:hypothetical protein
LPGLYRNYCLEPIIYRFSLAPFRALILISKEFQVKTIIDSIKFDDSTIADKYIDKVGDQIKIRPVCVSFDGKEYV